MTLEEVMKILRDHYTSTEIVELLGVDPDELTECLGGFVEDNFDRVLDQLEVDGYGGNGDE